MESVRSEAKALYARYTEVRDSGGDFDNADSKLQALHRLMMEAETAATVESHEKQTEQPAVGRELVSSHNDNAGTELVASTNEMESANEIQLVSVTTTHTSITAHLPQPIHLITAHLSQHTIA